MTNASLSGKKVLLVEDEPFIGTDLKSGLEQDGAGVVFVGAADEALAALERAQFDAAILDVHLRNDSSYPVADLLRARGTPFVFLSGYLTVREGYADVPFLAKPFKAEEVAAAVQKLLG